MTAQLAQFAHLDQSAVKEVAYAALEYKKVADDLKSNVANHKRSYTVEEYAEEYADAYEHEYPELTHDQIVEIYVAAYNE